MPKLKYFGNLDKNQTSSQHTKVSNTAVPPTNGPKNAELSQYSQIIYNYPISEQPQSSRSTLVLSNINSSANQIYSMPTQVPFATNNNYFAVRPVYSNNTHFRSLLAQNNSTNNASSLTLPVLMQSPVGSNFNNHTPVLFQPNQNPSSNNHIQNVQSSGLRISSSYSIRQQHKNPNNSGQNHQTSALRFIKPIKPNIQNLYSKRNNALSRDKNNGSARNVNFAHHHTPINVHHSTNPFPTRISLLSQPNACLNPTQLQHNKNNFQPSRTSWHKPQFNEDMDNINTPSSSNTNITDSTFTDVNDCQEIFSNVEKQTSIDSHSISYIKVVPPWLLTGENTENETSSSTKSAEEVSS